MTTDEVLSRDQKIAEAVKLWLAGEDEAAIATHLDVSERTVVDYLSDSKIRKKRLTKLVALAKALKAEHDFSRWSISHTLDVSEQTVRTALETNPKVSAEETRCPKKGGTFDDVQQEGRRYKIRCECCGTWRRF